MSNVLVVTGSLCMLITLGLTWCLVGVRASALMKSLFASHPRAEHVPSGTLPSWPCK